MESLIQTVEHGLLSDGETADFLTLHSGQLIVLTCKHIAVYKNVSSYGDPLGNGLIGLCPIPEDQLLKAGEGGFIKSYSSGYVELTEGMALLITPFNVSLFVNNEDALIGSNPLAVIALTAIDLR